MRTQTVRGLDVAQVVAGSTPVAHPARSAHLAERSFRNREVPGSTPGSGSHGATSARQGGAVAPCRCTAPGSLPDVVPGERLAGYRAPRRGREPHLQWSGVGGTHRSVHGPVVYGMWRSW